MTDVEVKHFKVGWNRLRRRQSDPGEYRFVDVWAGYRGVERIVPPAGGEHAFDIDQWDRHVQICVSPTGRSVRVFVDGVEIRRSA